MPIYIVKSWYKKGWRDKVWVPKTWYGLSDFNGGWLRPPAKSGDPIDVFYLDDKKLNVDTSTWSDYYWSGIGTIGLNNVWYPYHNGEPYIDNGIYYDNTKRLPRSGSSSTSYYWGTTWEDMTWSGGPTNMLGYDVFRIGDNTYYASEGSNYVLNSYSSSTWSTKSWTGLYYFYGRNVWTDGDRVFYSAYERSSASPSARSTQRNYVLDIPSSTWTQKTWNGYTSLRSGKCIWSDEDNIYYSRDSAHYELDKSSDTWIQKSWTGLSSFSGSAIWKIGKKIYYSNGTDQYELV